VTTGDPGTDSVVVLGVVAGLLLVLAVVTWPFENTARGRRVADRLLDWILGE